MKGILIFSVMFFSAGAFAQYYVYDPAVERATYTVKGQIVEGDMAKLSRMDQQISQLKDQLDRLSAILDTERKTSSDVELVRGRSGDPAEIRNAVNTNLLDVKKDVPAESIPAEDKKAGDFNADVDTLLDEHGSVDKDAVERKSALVMELKNLGSRINSAQTDAEVQKTDAAISAVSSALAAEQNREQAAMNRLVAGDIAAENERRKRDEEERKTLSRTLNADASKGVMDSKKAREILEGF